MSDEDNDFDDDLLDLELFFSENYEEMNAFIIFYHKVQKILKSNENIKVDELTTSRISPSTEKILPFTHKVLINSKSYLIFVRNDSDPNLTEEEWVEYKKLFSEDITQSGLIIVWNDKNLSSIKLASNKLYDPPEVVLDFIKNKRLPFKDLIDAELSSKDKISESIKKKMDELSDEIKLKNQEQDIISKFSKYLSKAFLNSKNNPHIDPFERSILDSIVDEDLEKIEKIFLEFLSYEKEPKALQEDIRRLVNKSDL